MIEAEWWDYDSTDELADAVASDIAFLIGKALDERSQALVAFPGGKSPAPVFDRLAKSKLGWDRVTIVPTDDRLVSPDSPLSNVALLARHFGALGARVIGLADGETANYRQAAADADQRLANLAWPLDLAWLGMGTDGHSASIFPGPDLGAALDAPRGRRVAGVMPDPLPPEAPVARVTLTRGAIAEARALIVTITGAEKRKVIEAAIEAADASSFPIGRVLAAADKPIDIHWSSQ